MKIGNVCVKIAGRESGEKVAIVDAIDKNFVVIAGPNVRRRRCNLRHLKLLEKSLDIRQGAGEGEVNKALRAAFPEEAKPAPPKKIEKPAPKAEKPPKIKEKKKEKVAKTPRKKAKKEEK
ncbi:MAG: 50S ribosomal protein L14e [Euryarchaeota archaeon]|nr:50S ribosomal protein L14e [Euryarchaeota archaeon]